MTRLSAKALPENIDIPGYERGAVRPGIVHFGVGNFHRAHQAVYVEDLLEQGDLRWGITGVSLRSPSMREALQPQDYLYTLAILGENTTYRVIGSIQDVLAAPQDPQAVIDLLAAPKTQLVSSTITEKGYGLTSGKVDFNHPAFKAELGSLENPITIYGYLARGIMARAENNEDAKLTIMCCDNISAGGELLRDGVRHLLGRHDEKALAWADDHVSFMSSMVDRVSPATDAGLRETVEQDTARRDVSPVSAEPFSQWIIEDNFAGERPAFDEVGAVFVQDIAPFETMKLRYLNAAHTIVSTLGYLYGDTYVHETLERPEILEFLRKALYENVLPHAAVPAGYDGAAYIEDVIKRFQNGNLPYANLQVGTDSSQKIQQRWFPTIDQALLSGADGAYFAFCLGAWAVFIQSALEAGVLNDPKLDAFKKVETESPEQRVRAYLEIVNADQFGFYHDKRFMTAVTDYARTIQNAAAQDKDVARALAEFTTS